MPQLQTLVRFFLEERGYHFFSQQNHHFAKELLIHDCLQTRQGHELIGQFLFCFLGQQQGLELCPLNSQSRQVIQWTRAKEHSYVHLGLSGKILNNKEVVQLFNQEPAIDQNSKSLTGLSTKDFFLALIQQMLNHYETMANTEREKIILWSAYLELEPNSIESLLKRGLSYYYLGNREHARFDLKRYFSFVKLDSASPEAKCAYFDLCEGEGFAKKTQTTEFTVKNLLH